MVTAGGARMIQQKQFTPIELATHMQKLGPEPKALQLAAECARMVGRPHPASDLAHLVERTGDVAAGSDAASMAEGAYA